MFKKIILSILMLSALSITPVLAAGNGGAGGDGGAGGKGGTQGANGMPGCDGGTKPAKDGKFYLPGTHEECNPSASDRAKAATKSH